MATVEAGRALVFANLGLTYASGIIPPRRAVKRSQRQSEKRAR
jgi:hypothetical protein